ncbi:acyl-CoA thioesterase [Algiphilus sp. NNCM1]|uniref:acyl-CoA thioesterase n=1 Tax=Algiphilus sp. TaxID=1872431 RepID=UPI001CA64C3B|nr:acyl-CoA thioesterase [Algiphilus sp.]MBY8965368.1 acyl-CoA thioesterase [Algiphilus acroporae]MCI5062060.1 acyl-CoA thioesterase [Algiphilus sp.]MCI5104702.1 acyl-CoA thioesterase [Algiphilus sp.]
MRFVASALRSVARPGHPLDAPLVQHSMVWPTDLNVGMHMDNVRYLQLMNRARNELLMRSGIMRAARARRLGVPVAQCVMRYKRSLMPFERFCLRTQIIGWNERRFFMAQDFVRDGQVVASGQLQYAFVGPEGRVAPATIFSALLGREAVSPPLPAELLD